LDGKEVWRFETGGPILTSPQICNNFIIFGSFDGNIYALDLNGRLLWKFSAGDKIGDVAVSKEKIFFGCRDGNIYCLNKKGILLWKFCTGSSISAAPLIHNEIVYIGNFDGNFYALTSNGQLLWKRAFSEQIAFNAVINDNLLIVPAGQTIYCLDLLGNIHWLFKTNHLITRPFMIADRVYFGSRGGCNLYALSTDGRLLWKFTISDSIAVLLATADRVYAGGWDGNLYCIDANGRKIWNFTTNNMITISMKACLHNGVLYFGNFGCNFYAITEDGQMLWKFTTSLSYPSPVDIEYPKEKRIEIVWKPTIEEAKKTKKEEVDIADYGQFSGKYIDIGKSDYLGRRKKGYF
jgi:outer membrane protein assembly factor BamB